MSEYYKTADARTLEPHFSRHMMAMTTENLNSKDDIAMELAARDQRIALLKEALLEAADDIADWGQYAGDYFMEKHGLDDDVAKYRSIANKEPGK